MAANLLEDTVDQGEGAVSEAATPGAWLGPDGEEFSGEIAAPGGVKVEVTGAQSGGEVPGFVNEALGSVGVRVNDEGGGVKLVGIGVASRGNRHVYFALRP
jgi:hypothetical protein